MKTKDIQNAIKKALPSGMKGNPVIVVFMESGKKPRTIIRRKPITEEDILKYVATTSLTYVAKAARHFGISEPAMYQRFMKMVKCRILARRKHDGYGMRIVEYYIP